MTYFRYSPPSPKLLPPFPVPQGLPKEKWTPVFITMSARTTANMVQEQVWGRVCLKEEGTVFFRKAFSRNWTT